jgi:hypothetical protein
VLHTQTLLSLSLSLFLSLSPASRVPSRFQVSWFIHGTTHASKPSNSTYTSHTHSPIKCTQMHWSTIPIPIHFIQSAKRNKNDLMICHFSSFIIVQQKQSFIERAKIVVGWKLYFYLMGRACECTSTVQKLLYTKCTWLAERKELTVLLKHSKELWYAFWVENHSIWQDSVEK